MSSKVYILLTASLIIISGIAEAKCRYSKTQPAQIRACALLGDLAAQKDYVSYFAKTNDLTLIGESNRQWIEEMAANGDSTGERAMALLALSGKFGEKNEEDAYKWMEKAAEHDDAAAQMQLSDWLTEGFAGKKEPDTAKQWLTRAAKNGNPEAQYKLAQNLMLDSSPENVKEACKLYKESAPNYAPSARQAGECYERGTGVELSEKEAEKWYKKAAEAKDPIAQRRLARLLLQKTEKESHIEAAKWLKAASEQNDAQSQYWLGALYATGKGVKQNPSEMMYYYRKSADNGYAPAQMVVGYLLETGSGTQKNDAEAVKWYQKAAEQGDMNALYNLGLKYAKGEGVAQDFVLAHVCFNLAAAAGNIQAGQMRDAAAALLNPTQLAEAQRLAREWQPGNSFGKGQPVMNGYNKEKEEAFLR